MRLAEITDPHPVAVDIGTCYRAFYRRLFRPLFERLRTAAVDGLEVRDDAIVIDPRRFGAGDDATADTPGHTARTRIERLLAAHGWRLADWRRGFVEREVERVRPDTGERIRRTERRRLVPVLREIVEAGGMSATEAESLIRAFEQDPTRRGASAERQGRRQYLVLTFDPVEIAHMSTRRGWTSCRDLEHPDNVPLVVDDLESGVFAAWVVDADDVDTIDRPTARRSIRVIVGPGGSMHFEPAPETYGAPPPWFEETVRRVIDLFNRLVGGRPGLYRVPRARVAEPDIDDEDDDGKLAGSPERLIGLDRWQASVAWAEDPERARREWGLDARAVGLGLWPYSLGEILAGLSAPEDAIPALRRLAERLQGQDVARHLDAMARILEGRPPTEVDPALAFRLFEIARVYEKAGGGDGLLRRLLIAGRRTPMLLVPFVAHGRLDLADHLDEDLLVIAFRSLADSVNPQDAFDLGVRLCKRGFDVRRLLRPFDGERWPPPSKAALVLGLATCLDRLDPSVHGTVRTALRKASRPVVERFERMARPEVRAVLGLSGVVRSFLDLVGWTPEAFLSGTVVNRPRNVRQAIAWLARDPLLRQEIVRLIGPAGVSARLLAPLATAADDPASQRIARDLYELF